MKRIVLTSAICHFTFYIFAQSFTPDVIGSAGTFATSASGSMSWTIGEVMTETYSSANNFFTQGFHQPESIPISVNEISSSQNISVYPNPTSGEFTVYGLQSEVQLQIFNSLGQMVFETTVNRKQETVNLSGANGIYLLNIINKETNTRSSYKINKAE
ncbi:MAG: T9SS type A sorting domain-containing protein [Bacteroidetes bacterium]|nr:T9SS type A sorting domain-containing protein [Bacteroidota bacterium]